MKEIKISMKRKIFSILLTLVLALSLCLVTAVPVAAAEIPVHSGMSTAEINTAIAGATSEDVVQFATGDYILTEPLVVGVAGVTLQGDITTPSNVVINAGTIGGTDRDCFQVRANSVTIQGFEMQNAFDEDGYESDTGRQNAGIMIGQDGSKTLMADGAPIQVDGGTFSNNIFYDCTYGIYIYESKSIEVSDNQFTLHRRVSRWNGGQAVFMFADAADAQMTDIIIRDNQIYNCEKHGIGSYSNPLLLLLHLDGLQITGNNIHDFSLNYPEAFPEGSRQGTPAIEIADTDGSVIVENNTIHNEGTGLGKAAIFYLNPHLPAGTGGVTAKINGNTIHDVWMGIFIVDDFPEENMSVEVKNNTIYNVTTREGILTSFNGDLEVDGNSIHHVPKGIWLTQDRKVDNGDVSVSYGSAVVTNNNIYNATEYGIHYGDSTLGTSLVVHFNNIHDNAIGIQNDDLDYTIDATNNWWGDASGPTHLSNPDGTGDMVSDGVDYNPWLTQTSVVLTGEGAVPVVVTGAATSIALYSATLNGELTDMGGASKVHVSFYYLDTDEALGYTSSTVEVDAIGSFSVDLTGLTHNTTYDFQAKATIGELMVYGDFLSFTTTVERIGISVSPTSIDFGRIPLGQSSAIKTVTVSNTGDVSVDLDASLANISDPDVYTTGLKIDERLVADWDKLNLPSGDLEVPSLVLTVPIATLPGTYTATLVFWAEPR